MATLRCNFGGKDFDYEFDTVKQAENFQSNIQDMLKDGVTCEVVQTKEAEMQEIIEMAAYAANEDEWQACPSVALDFLNRQKQ
jgi:hypothetical protein